MLITLGINVLKCKNCWIAWCTATNNVFAVNLFAAWRRIVTSH